MSDFTPRTLISGPDVVTAYDHGAHVAQWVHDDVPVVWVSKHAQYLTDQAIRGGVPVIWPWFADGPAGDMKPAHGLLRTACWRLVEAQSHRLTWEIDQNDLKSQPGVDTFEQDFKAQLQVQVDGGLSIGLTVHNTGERALSYEAALHTYLHVADVQAVTITGLDGTDFFDKVTQQSQRQRGDVVLTEQTDRIYHASGVVTVSDPVLERDIAVASPTGSHTVLWNPWREKAAGMSDLGDEEWSQMVCVESARLGADQVVLRPGESHTLTTRITVGKSRSGRLK